MDDLPHYVITSKERWDSQAKPLRIGHAGFGIKAKYKDKEFETDQALRDISPVFVEDKVRKRMIGSVNIKEWYDQGNQSQPGCNTMTGTRQIGAVYARQRHTSVSAETLSRIWNMGLETAQQTLRVTIQNGLRTAIHPITRRFRADHLRLHRKLLNTTFYMDTMFSRVQLLQGN